MAKNLYLLYSTEENSIEMVTLGLMEILLRNLPEVAFFRPIVPFSSEKELIVSFSLIKRYFNIKTPIEEMYGCTSQEVEEMMAEGLYDEIMRKIVSKYKALEEKHTFVLIEGAENNDDGTIDFDLNLKIAHALSSPLFLFASGKNKNENAVIQNIKFNISLIHERKCDLLGVCITGVKEGRADHYHRSLEHSENMNGLFTAVLPDSKIINTPTINEIVSYFNATVLFGEEQLHKQVNHYSVGAMNLENYLWGLPNGTLIITTGDRVDLVMGAILASQSQNYPEISGILLSVDYVINNMVLQLVEGLANKIPIIVVRETLNEIIPKIHELKPRIIPADRFKIATVMNIFDAHIDGETLVQLIFEHRANKMTPKMFEYMLIQKAKSCKKTIVLPEGEDERILYAAETLLLRDVVDLILLGKRDVIIKKIQELGIQIPYAKIIDPETSDDFTAFAEELMKIRASKGMTLEAAKILMKDVNYFGTMMVHKGKAHGMVSGAVHSTADTIRPAFQIIKTQPGCSIVSSVFIMSLEDRVLVYGDCAVNPDPTAEELAQIASSSTETAKLFEIEPKVAMLSYSSGDSGKGEDVDKVRKATEIAKTMKQDVPIEGPIQYDAAVSKEVAKKKMPGSKVAGEATLFIFPDLNTGNNTYKAVQRETGAIAIGPILQGLNKPVNDLSRGCTVDDVINTIIITAIQAQDEDGDK